MLEFLAEQTQKSIDRIDRTLERLDGKIDDLRNDVDRKIDDLRNDVDRKIGDLRNDLNNKFTWLIGGQFAAIIGILGYAATLFAK